LASHYHVKEADDIPPGWYDVTRRDALNNLREIFRIDDDLSDCEGKVGLKYCQPQESLTLFCNEPGLFDQKNETQFTEETFVSHYFLV
jgi:hypothetical protein